MIVRSMIKNASLILSILKKAYPTAHIALRYHTPWELLVAVILSAQCTDVTVNKVTETLFAKYPTIDAYIHADSAAFEKDIKSTGFYHDKAKHILAAATYIKGHVPKTMEDMLKIPGVGRKTANVVLGNAYGIVEGIAVDTHVMRLVERLQLVSKNAYKNPIKIEQELMAIIPKKDWFTVTYVLIDHGRAVCHAKNPNCAGCVVEKLCPSSRLHG